MDLSPIYDDAYKAFGGEEQYRKTHTYVYGLSDRPFIMENRNGPFIDKNFFDKDKTRRFLLSKIDDHELIMAQIDKCTFGINRDNIERLKDFEYKWQLFPQYELDWDDLNDKFLELRENIEYRKSRIHIEFEK